MTRAHGWSRRAVVAAGLAVPATATAAGLGRAQAQERAGGGVRVDGDGTRARRGGAGERRRGLGRDDHGGADGLNNPHRGFRYEMSYNARDLTSPWPNEADHPADAARTLDLLRERYGPGAGVTQLYFYLYDYATTRIPDSALRNMQHIFDGLRTKGCTAVLRFAYDDGVRPARRYTVQDIQGHIRRLAPLVERNSDVVSVWQAGFLGAWGEWGPNHYDHQNYPEAVTAIMTALTEALPDGVETQMRYAELRRRVTANGPLEHIGFHNDYLTLGGGKWDYYVPGNPGWQDYLDVSATHVMDGEMPWDKGQSEDPYAWDEVIEPVACARRLHTLRWDTLSLVHNATVTIPAWKSGTLTERQVREAQLPVSDGYFRDRRGAAVTRSPFEYLRDHLGYRLEIQRVRHDRHPGARRRLRAEADVVNRGFSPPKHPRPVRLVLLDSAGRTVADADTGADWRTWQPSGGAETDEAGRPAPVATVGGTLQVPRGAHGRHRIGLALPDPRGGGTGSAVRCANADVGWVNGVNVLAEVTL
ncbi:DUF4874 domain-containing protein [Streptomyces iconiensis]|uniref:DUF4874 domain-containing protein n=1 Tax=Streptomyces iconiensis TaxID=1384038 RepID=A0ABT7AAY7_9ACTN|nr:DUF4874 domain-containing protein [Streptomyces iconiensis]MDJ1138495.1 DUF4874 domain-containing protein [Streptomyces iconiensis]